MVSQRRRSGPSPRSDNRHDYRRGAIQYRSAPNLWRDDLHPLWPRTPKTAQAHTGEGQQKQPGLRVAAHRRRLFPRRITSASHPTKNIPKATGINSNHNHDMNVPQRSFPYYSQGLLSCGTKALCSFNQFGVLSIDVDGNDYWFLERPIEINPSVICIEYNATLGKEPITVPYDETFERHEKHPSGWYHGASLSALSKLAASSGLRIAVSIVA